LDGAPRSAVRETRSCVTERTHGVASRGLLTFRFDGDDSEEEGWKPIVRHSGQSQLIFNVSNIRIQS